MQHEGLQSYIIISLQMLPVCVGHLLWLQITWKIRLQLKLCRGEMNNCLLIRLLLIVYNQ